MAEQNRVDRTEALALRKLIEGLRNKAPAGSVHSTDALAAKLGLAAAHAARAEQEAGRAQAILVEAAFFCCC